MDVIERGEKNEQTFKPALEYIVKKIEKNLDEQESSFPFVTINGKWEICKDEDWDLETFTDEYWCNGFWIGMLWLAYMETKNKKYEKLAYEWMRLIEQRKNDGDHDLGFVFFPSFVKGYKLTGDIHLRDVSLDAADSLLYLFNTKSNFIQTRPEERGIAAIDSMMNLFLMWWTYEETKDKRYYDAAFSHSVATMKNMIREDGSTIHIIKFNLMSGEIIKKITLQGYSDTSCWSRGQSWAIYGFTVAYEKTKYNDFLITAERVADYFISHLPEDYVPYWDFNDPAIPNTVKDSSAAAIASSALLDLAKRSEKKEFRDTALNILNSLCNHYLAEEDEDGILKHGCFHKPEGIWIDESLIWGIIIL